MRPMATGWVVKFSGLFENQGGIVSFTFPNEFLSVLQECALKNSLNTLNKLSMERPSFRASFKTGKLCTASEFLNRSLFILFFVFTHRFNFLEKHNKNNAKDHEFTLSTSCHLAEAARVGHTSIPYKGRRESRGGLGRILNFPRDGPT